MEAGERRLKLSSTSSKSRKLTVHVNRQCRLCGERCHLSKGEVNQECLLSPGGSRCSRSMMVTFSPSSSAVCCSRCSQVSMPLPFRTCSMRWPSFLRLAIVSHAEILAGLKQPPVGDAVVVVCTGQVCTKTSRFLFVKLRREARTRYEDFCEDVQEKYVACGQSDTEAPGEGFEIHVGLFQEERWCPALTAVSELALLLWPQPFFAGPHRDLNPRAQAQFAEDVLDVLLNRAVVDDQELGDLPTRFALCDQASHFALALGEAAEGAFGGTACEGRSQQRAAWKWGGLDRQLPCRKSLLWGHRASLGPRRGKSLLPEVGACTGHRTVIVRSRHGRQGYSPGLAQGLCRPPEPCCPHELALRRHYTCQSFQGRGDIDLVAHLLGCREALLVESSRCLIFTLDGGDPCQQGKRVCKVFPTLAPLSQEHDTLFCQSTGGHYVALTECNLSHDGKRASNSLRVAHLSDERQSLLEQRPCLRSIPLGNKEQLCQQHQRQGNPSFVPQLSEQCQALLELNKRPGILSLNGIQDRQLEE